MNTQQIAVSIVGKPRTAQRVKFRRLMGSVYNRQQKKWEDSDQVKALFKLADQPNHTFFPAKNTHITKYLLGQYVEFNFGDVKRRGRIMGTVLNADDNVEYLIMNESGCMWYHKEESLKPI